MADFWQMVEFSHLLMSRQISKGAIVIDATAGNGHDSLFLARIVGEDGKVYSFDIQEKAIANTARLLAEHHLLDRVELIKDGHQNLDKYIKKEIDGMIFNLGYLPGGDKEITTRKDTTITALEKGLKLLKYGGIITMVVYTGHPGGREELEAILALVDGLDPHIYNVLNYKFINQKSAPEILAIIRRRAEERSS
ncbi:MAG: class I SAM-dependent methyltransferase [Halanaerobiales bacterium]|nr:class I SAM-dependent methyltransferase [Bacillota bacterium]HOA40558.1 class I SAM-dependent methyltransferase [Halanaerobiales bacterium]HPZ62716.1 class I SAM-dependent methyltransferase [Halanaerobiales bacterium]HQD04073.1 class I SAM-dependent methyltransferase [Halanaerobiales bacterium]